MEMEIEIKERFKNLIPPLEEQELNLLEESILLNGITDDIQVWIDPEDNGTYKGNGTKKYCNDCHKVSVTEIGLDNNILCEEGHIVDNLLSTVKVYIVDGHNRYNISLKHNIEITKVKYLDFDTEDDVCLYIIDKQLGRRNIGTYVRLELNEVKKEILENIAKKNQLSTLKQNNRFDNVVKTVDDDKIENMKNNELTMEDLDWFNEIKEEVQKVYSHNEDKLGIVINQTIKDRLWRLSDEEYDNLENSITGVDGCRDRLILWGNILVDGHNRYEICKKHNIKFETYKKEFENIEEVLRWVDLNQFGRRNLNDTQVSITRGRISKNNKLEIGNHIGNQYTKMELSQNVTIPKNQQTSAKELGVSRMTLNRDEKFVEAIEKIEKNVDRSTYNDIINEKIIVSKQDIQKIAQLGKDEQINVIQKIKETGKNVATIIKKGEIAQIKNDIETGKFILPEGKFEIIMMDVPWSYDTEYDESNIMGRSTTPYPTMTLKEIYDLPIPSNDDSILFFWTTQKFLEESFKIIRNYGYEYKATMVWNKDTMGIGKTLRLQCEFCLVCFKGKPIWKITDMRDIITEKRREHSRKPDTIYNIINESLIGRKLDYFSREQRDGWETFGYEKFKNN